MSSRIRMMTFGLAGLIALGGCASTGTNGGGGDSDLLTREEIEASSHTNAMDLIRAERPQWLRIRGAVSIVTPQEITVWVDGMQRGTLGVLDQIPTANIQEIRHYSASEAQFRFGTGNAMGAIEIITRSSS